YVDHTLTDQSSILRFVEDNWELGRIGDRSFDEAAGSLLGLFDFDRPEAGGLFLDPDTGLPLPGAPPQERADRAPVVSRAAPRGAPPLLRSEPVPGGPRALA